MHIDELHSRHRRGGQHRAGNRIRDIVEFQVEEDAGAQGRDFFDGGRTRSRKKLVADLEHAHKIGNLLRELHRGR